MHVPGMKLKWADPGLQNSGYWWGISSQSFFSSLQHFLRTQIFQEAETRSWESNFLLGLVPPKKQNLKQGFKASCLFIRHSKRSIQSVSEHITAVVSQGPILLETSETLYGPHLDSFQLNGENWCIFLPTLFFSQRGYISNPSSLSLTKSASLEEALMQSHR